METPDARMVPTVCPGCGIKETATAPGGTELGLPRAWTGRGNRVLCTFGLCCLLRILVVGRRSEIIVLFVDVCVAGGTTEGRMKGSLSLVLATGRDDLDPVFSFETLEEAPFSLVAECKQFLLCDASVDFEVVFGFPLLSFPFLNSCDAISTSVVKQTAVCDGARLFSMSCHVYSSFNFGGRPSLQNISPNVIFPQVSNVQKEG